MGRQADGPASATLHSTHGLMKRGRQGSAGAHNNAHLGLALPAHMVLDFYGHGGALRLARRGIILAAEVACGADKGARGQLKRGQGFQLCQSTVGRRQPTLWPNANTDALVQGLCTRQAPAGACKGGSPTNPHESCRRRRPCARSARRRASTPTPACPSSRTCAPPAAGPPPRAAAARSEGERGAVRSFDGRSVVGVGRCRPRPSRSLPPRCWLASLPRAAPRVLAHLLILHIGVALCARARHSGHRAPRPGRPPASERGQLVPRAMAGSACE